MTSAELWAVVRGWAVIQVIGLAALPLAYRVLPGLADRGYGVAKPLGLLLAGWVCWMFAMVTKSSLSSPVLVAAIAGMAATGVLLLGRSGLRRLGTHLRGDLAGIAVQEALFAAALGVGLWLRLHTLADSGAAIGPSEQPMDAAMISGILASTEFPPQDPWLAGHPINYYYFGHLLMAVVIRLTGVGIGLGFTLAFALVLAMSAQGVFSVVWNLLRAAPTAQGTGRARGRARGIVFALAGVVLVLGIGNQAGALQVVTGSEKVVAVGPATLRRAIANGLGDRKPIELGPDFPSGSFDGTNVLVPRDTRRDFNWWWSSRTVWDTETHEDGTISKAERITEFPFFAFALGNLHAHMVAMPWVLLAVATSAAVALLATGQPGAGGRVARIAVSGIVLGALYVINSWDFPTFLLLYLGALWLAHLRSEGHRTPRAVARLAGEMAATTATAYVLYLPFHLTFTLPSRGFPFLPSPARTGILPFLVMFGSFLVPLLAWALAEGWKRPGVRNRPVRVAAALAAAGLAVAGPMAGWPLLGLLPLGIWAAVVAARHPERSVAFGLMAFAAGALIVWSVDVVSFRDASGGPTRSNSIFKFYYQVWILWGMLAAFALWRLAGRRGRLATPVWALPFALLLAGAAVYPVLSLKGRAGGTTLDGFAFLDRESPATAAAARWLLDHTDGSTRVLEAPGESWRAQTSRLSTITGRPTLVGWFGGHEMYWRGGDERMRDVVVRQARDATAIYETGDWDRARRLLEDNGIRFVFVGPYERTVAAQGPAGPDALAKFERHLQPVVAERDGTLYRVPGRS
jgi:YYY domain-containing protein